MTHTEATRHIGELLAVVDRLREGGPIGPGEAVTTLEAIIRIANAYLNGPSANGGTTTATEDDDG